MEGKEVVTKTNFFKKVWYSITKFEQYPSMATEGVGRAIKYLIILTAFVTIFITLGSLIEMKRTVEDLAKYIDENIPEFSYIDGNLTMDIQESLIVEDVQYDGIDKIVINTLTETDEQKQQIENNNLVVGTTIFLFKDEIILEVKTDNEQTLRQNYTYNDFLTSYTQQYIEKFDKADFIQYLTSDKMYTFYLSYGTSIFISLLLINLIVVLLDSFEIALLGWITTIISRIKMRFVAIYNMAVYSLTLPMILNILYVIVNYFTDFTITYFQVAYITIAYIYLTAAIFILKDDFIKKMQEVEKIKQEQLKVREEIKKEEQEKEEENKDKEDNKDKKDEKGDEPQGSEA